MIAFYTQVTRQTISRNLVVPMLESYDPLRQALTARTDRNDLEYYFGGLVTPQDVYLHLRTVFRTNRQYDEKLKYKWIDTDKLEGFYYVTTSGRTFFVSLTKSKNELYIVLILPKNAPQTEHELKLSKSQFWQVGLKRIPQTIKFLSGIPVKDNFRQADID